MALMPDFARFAGEYSAKFIVDITQKSAKAFAVNNGNIPKWQSALTARASAPAHYNAPYIYIPTLADKEQAKLLIPWRKGPFRFDNIKIDSEWNGSLKWQRLLSYLDIADKKVLDVGAGNGYFSVLCSLFGACNIIALEPFLLYNYQFQYINNHISNVNNVAMAPLRLEELSDNGGFDIVLSMGVLYHHKSPIEHLFALKKQLIQKGTAIVETLVVEGEEGYALTPTQRYAGMRNVWFIPSIATLFLWLQKVGFNDITLLDDNITTSTEQHRTEWLGDNPQSLEDFIIGEHTIEGYPRPRRVMVSAKL